MIKKSTKELSDQLGLTLEDPRLTNYSAGERLDYANRAIRFLQSEIVGLNDQALTELYFTKTVIDSTDFSADKKAVMPYDFETAIRTNKIGEAYPINIVSKSNIDRTDGDYADEARACFYSSPVTPAIANTANSGSASLYSRGKYTGTFNKKFRFYLDGAVVRYDVQYLARPVRNTGSSGYISVWSEFDISNSGHAVGQTHVINVHATNKTFQIASEGVTDFPMTKEWQRCDSGNGYHIWVKFYEIDSIEASSQWSIAEVSSLGNAGYTLVEGAWTATIEGIEIKAGDWSSAVSGDDWFFNTYYDREPTVMQLNFQPSSEIEVMHSSSVDIVNQIDNYTFLPFPLFFDAIYLYALLMCRNRNEENFQMDAAVYQPVRNEVRILANKLNRDRNMREKPDSNFTTNAYM